MIDIRLIPYESDSGLPWKELAPHLFWAAVALFFFFVIGPSRIRAALARATKLGFAGIEIELRAELDNAAAQKGTKLPQLTRDRLARRLDRSKSFLECARVLWVDDAPEGNLAEMELLRRLCVQVDLAKTTELARERLEGAVYDIVLSDMRRGTEGEAGLQLVPFVEGAPLKPALIFYVGSPRATPSGAFGLTTVPHELFQLVLNAMEQRRG